MNISKQTFLGLIVMFVLIKQTALQETESIEYLIARMNDIDLIEFNIGYTICCLKINL